MEPFTVIGFLEDDEQRTFVETIHAETFAQAGVMAARRGVSLVAIIPGDHTAAAEFHEFAGCYTAYNGMDGGDEITDEERGELE